MARLPRYVLPGEPQHVIQRGNNRCPIFRSDRDYGVFLKWLAEASRKHRCDIHAFVLMTNHVHLLVTPHAEESISKAMQSLGRRYVQYFNKRYGRTGTLWEGRYRATLVDTERYLWACHRYIESNPVRAGLVRHPAEYAWSSHRRHAHGKPNPVVRPHPLYESLGRDPRERQERYRGFFQTPLPEQTLAAIRQATNKGWALGSDGFKTRIGRILGRRVDPLPRGRRKV